MYKVGVIGDRESIAGYRASGLEAFPCKEETEAREALHKMVKDEFAIIFITERLAEKIPKDIARYASATIPAIIPIPDRHGATGAGMMNVRKAVERAVGADILFGGGK